MHDLRVQDGKLFCTIHNSTHPIGKWEDHEGHPKADIPMRHVLYVAQVCTQCDAILIDEEQ